MKRNLYMTVKIIIFLIILSFSHLLAQEEILPVSRRGYIDICGSFQAWSLGDLYAGPINQLALPMTLVLPIGNNFNLTVMHSQGRTWWEKTASDTLRLTGASDTWVQGSLLFLNKKAMINAGFGVPTGKTELNNNEFDLSTWLSFNIFRFRMPTYGQGPCGKIGGAIALPIHKNVILGLGGNYLYQGAYVPVSYRYGDNNSRTFREEYRPGDEVSGHAGLDMRLGKNMKIMLDGLVTFYQCDLLGSDEIYGSGQKITTTIGVFYRMEDKYVWTRVRYRQKGKNEILRGLSLVEEEKNSNGDQIEIDLIYKIKDFEGGGLFILGEGRFYDKNEYGAQGANAYGGGFGFDYRLSTSLTVNFGIKYIVGKRIRRFTPDENIEGMDTALTFRFEF